MASKNIILDKIGCKLEDLIIKREKAISDLVYMTRPSKEAREDIRLLDYGISLLKGLDG